MSKATIRASVLEIRPLTPARVDDVRVITASTWGSQCFDLWWRFSDEERKSIFGSSAGSKDEKTQRRRGILRKLARRRHAPVLVAYIEDEPAGFVSLGPRADYDELRKQKTTQPVDDVPAWVIPCITVRKSYRRQGVALALLKAAVEYARAQGAPAIEGYPRAEKKRFDDGSVYMGTPALFRRAGFTQIRGVEKGLPRYYAPRVTMRASAGTEGASSRRARRRSGAAPS